jgi:predicted TIM-barrel fold metal-dependent hydrolase
MTIDGLVYLGASRFGSALTPAQAVEFLDRDGIATAIVTPTHRPDHDFRRGNETVTEAASASAGRMIALARADPWDGEQAVRMLEEAVTKGGARGLFLHPLEEQYRINDPRVRPLARAAADLGVPIVVATGYQGFSEPVQITQFARWCPEVPVVLTNGGQFNISGLAQTDAGLALQLGNVFVHTSGVYRDDWIAVVVSDFGPERIMFASAAPIMSVRYELRRVELAHVPEQAKSLILDGNARRIFKLGGEQQ